MVNRWPELTEPAIAWNEIALESKVKQYERERSAAQKATSLQEIVMSDTRTFAWLKRPNATEINRSPTDELPLDAALQTEHLQKQWNKLWLQEPLCNFDSVAPLVPSHSEVALRPPKASTLWKLAQTAKGKAAGPDGWHGSDFAKLSPDAFVPFTILWEKCLEIGAIPQAWVHARTVFIDKPAGDGKRPLSIAAICWRLVASAAVTDLKAWIQSWADESLCGGLPERRADELHIRLFQVFHNLGNHSNSTVQGLKQDLQKCFDNCCHIQAIDILLRFGLPSSLAKVIRCFYQLHHRWIETAGSVARTPTRPTRSILQGCPFSVMLLSGIMTVWARQMKLQVPRIQLGIFIDDRTIWTEASTNTLRKAIQTSQQLDALFGFKNNVDKESFFSNKPWVRQRLKALGKVAPAFTLLGVHYCSGMHVPCAEAQRITERILLLLSRIKFLIKSRERRRYFITSLVIPVMVWSSFWTQPSKKTLTKWTSAIERCVLGHIAPGRSPTLVWALIGLKLHPHFQSFIQGLRNLRWQKLHLNNATDAVYTTRSLNSILRKLAWNVDNKSNLITDQGTLSFETDSFKSICGFAQQAWFREMWKVDKRVSQLEREQWPDLQVLNRASANLDKINWQREAVLTGAGVDGRMLSKFHKKEVFCFCGESNPNRRHLTWHCESFTTQDVPARQTAAEGLLVLSRPCEMQFAPNDLLKQGLSTLSFQTQLDLISIVTSAFQNPQGNMSILASDGGSSRCARCTRGAWAIANCHQATGGTLQGFDQSSYAAEINAVLILLLAIEQCLHLFAHDIIILIDNQDVAKKFEFLVHNPENGPSMSWEYPWIWNEICFHLRNLPSSCMHVVWIPSHNKQPDWQAPSGLSSSTCRGANQLADQAASEILIHHADICLCEIQHENLRAQWMHNALNLQQEAIIAITRNFERMNAVDQPIPDQGVG